MKKILIPCFFFLLSNLTNAQNYLPSSPDWTYKSNQVNAFMGHSVEATADLNNDGINDLLIGTPYFDHNGLTNCGKVEVFLGSSSGISSAPNKTLYGSQADERFGASITNLGGIGHPCVDDILIGSPGHQVPIPGFPGQYKTNVGKASLYFSIVGSGLLSLYTSFEGENANDNFGAIASSAGDINGDGTNDFLISSKYWSNRGKVYCYSGTATINGNGTAPNPIWTKIGDVTAGYNEALGASIASGDFNNDGYSDIALGCPHYSVTGQSLVGRTVIYYGSSSGVSTINTSIVGNASSGQQLFGSAVCNAGDINDDGIHDLLVSSPYFDLPGKANTGKVECFLGSTSGLPSSASSNITGNLANERIGFLHGTINSLGDINGDGYGDILLGSSLQISNSTISYPETFRVITGSNSGSLNSGTSYSIKSYNTINSSTFGSHFPRVVASIGDLDGDGYSDVVIGHSCLDDGQLQEGGVLVYYSNVDPSKANSTILYQSSAQTSFLTNSIGDINSDGFDDIVVYDEGNNELDFFQGKEGGLNSSVANYTISTSNEIVIGNFPYGDINGDGYSDICLIDKTNDQLRVVYGSNGNYSGSYQIISYIPPLGYNLGKVECIGDINTDGYSDYAINLTSGGTSYEKVEILKGGPYGISSNSSWSYTFSDLSATRAGDVNRDGFSDLLILKNSSEVIIFIGSNSGLGTTASYSLTVPSGSNFTISSCNPIGDLNDDGCGDIVVSAQDRYMVFHGSVNGPFTNASNSYLNHAPDWLTTKQFSLVNLSDALSAGDFNGDGYSDLMCPVLYSAPDQYKLFIYYGYSQGLSNQSGSILSIEPDAIHSFPYFNQSNIVHSFPVGDVNADGSSEIIVGIPNTTSYTPPVQNNEMKLVYGKSDNIVRRLRQKKAGDVNIVPSLNSNSSQSVELEFFVKGFRQYPRGKIRAQFEILSDNLTFEQGFLNALEVNSDWQSPLGKGNTFKIKTNLLTNSKKVKWRVRIAENEGCLANLVDEKWFYFGSNGAFIDGDFRAEVCNICMAPSNFIVLRPDPNTMASGSAMLTWNQSTAGCPATEFDLTYIDLITNIPNSMTIPSNINQISFPGGFLGTNQIYWSLKTKCSNGFSNSNDKINLVADNFSDKTGFLSEETSYKNQINSNFISIFPNPSNGIFNIKVASIMENEQTYSMQITDITGKVVHKKNSLFSNKFQEINLSHLSNGYYIVQIQIGERIETEKIIKN